MKVKSGEDFRGLLEAAPDAITIVSGDGAIVLVNNQAEKMFGYPREELVGQPIEMLMPERFRLGHISHRLRYVAEPHTRPMGAGLELFGRRKDGSEFPVDIMLSPMEAVEGLNVIAVIRDITDRKQAEHHKALVALEARARQQTAVAELSQHALTGKDLAALLDDAVTLVPQILGLEYCKVLELQPDGEELVLRAGAGWNEGIVENETIKAGKESQAGFTLLVNAPVIVEDMRTETRFSKPRLLLDHHVVSGMSVVIHGRGRPYGVLGAHTITRRNFSSDDVHFLQSIANVIAAAIERRDLEQELLEISGREQRRIGQDLHDGLCQQLVGIEFRMTVLARELAQSPAAQQEIGSISQLVRDAARQARMLASGLSPVHLEASGLMLALEEIASHAENLFGISCRVECREPVLVSDNGMARHLYRIAQEAVTNAVKHGKAKSILVALSATNERATLRVTDDGKGFDPKLSDDAGMGLRIMQYRAEMIGATVRIGPAEGGGTAVVCTFNPNR